MERKAYALADVRLGASFGTAGRDAAPDSAGFYLECGGHIARCTYQPTYGFEGFGAAKRRVRYPSGAIRVPFDKAHNDAPSLDAAKSWFAAMVETDESEPQCNRGPFYREGVAPIIKVHGHPGLVAINTDQRLYVVPCGDGYSCWGFDVAESRGRAVAAWLESPFGNGKGLPALGTPEHFDAFRAAMDAGAAYAQRTGQRCPADLTPQLVGLEGKRVEVVDRYGETRRFIVGKSTGWLPCHLELEPRADGGISVTGAPFKSIHVIR